VPEFELFDLGHVPSMNRLLDKYGLPYGGQVHCDLVMGVPGGMPGTHEALVAAVAALPAGASWSATGVGRSSACRSRWPRCPRAATCGWAWRTR
jgi:3-keto-5-aminohexanoate cleavage enzyme